MRNRKRTSASVNEVPGDSSILRSKSVSETELVAANVAATIRDGECIALHGELGAGKTQFVRGLVKAFGGDIRAVSSPTFVLLNIYDTPRMKVFHIDAYRVAGPDELDAIGFGELLSQGGVVVVEWAGRIASLLPADHLSIQLIATSLRTRTIEIKKVVR